MKTYTKTTYRLVAVANTDYIQLLNTTENIGYFSVQVWWKDVNVFDGSVKVGIKRVPDAPFNAVPTLTHAIDNEDGNGNGSVILTHKKYHGCAIGISIDKGTTTSGTLEVCITVDE